MSEQAVVVAGGGPTGLMLAAELALAGVEVAVLERRASQDLPGSRAGGLHSRTIEVLDQRGVADRFLAAGDVAQVAAFAHIPLDIGDFPTRHPYGLALWQNRFERLLADWVVELGVPIRYGCEVTGLEQHDDRVDVRLGDGRRLSAAYLGGCDGGRSRVRELAGIEFPGWDASTSYLIAEAELSEVPPFGIRRDESGLHALGPLEDGRVRVVLQEARVGRADEPTLRELGEAIVAAYGTDYGLRDATWISRFTDAARQAASYRDRRVLLAGDAAHVHSPVGGQGLNVGVQDAVNLGWKLAQVVDGTSPDDLLDSYHDERHPVAARVLRNTMAQTPLISGGGERIEALRETMSELLALDEPRKRLAAMVSGLDVRYDLGDGHPLLGRRMPDLDLVAASGPRRVFALLHEARPVLLDLGRTDGLDIAPWADRVRLVRAEHAGPWELPVVGEVAAPAAVLIRPDGHVAWVGDGTGAGLADALATWSGPPLPPAAGGVSAATPASPSGLTAP